MRHDLPGLPESARQPPPGRARGTAQRQALLAAAGGLVAEKGFEGLRTREVAERAGLNPAMLHYHFATKEALVVALAHDVVRRLSPPLQPPDAAGEPPGRQLHRHFRAVRVRMRREPALFATLGELILRAGRDPALAPVLAVAEGDWKEHFSGLLRRGAEQRAFRGNLDPGAGAEVVVAFFKGTTLSPPGDHGVLERAVVQLEVWIVGA